MPMASNAPAKIILFNTGLRPFHGQKRLMKWREEQMST